MLKPRKIGPYLVSSVGIGCMNLTDTQTEENAIKIIHEALNQGISLFDTADIYGNGNNEIVLGKAINSWIESNDKISDIVLATKGGIVSSEKISGVKKFFLDSSLDYLRDSVEKSVKRLNVNKIQLWQHHRADPLVPYQTQIENILTLKNLGYVENIGISNVSAEMLKCAINVGGTPEQGGIISVQNEFSPFYRCWEEVIQVCEQFGIAFIPWSPLGGKSKSFKIALGENHAIDRISKNKSVSPYSIVIAWHLAKYSNSIPISGISKFSSLKDLIIGASLELSFEEIVDIDRNLPESDQLRSELYEIPDCTFEFSKVNDKK
jgi:aryl-alcohol dehydrogenase-like predicted oxidoreductase